MSAMWITLIILLLTIIAFISNKVPMSVLAVIICLALAIFKVLPPERAFGGFINTNVIMFAGMFVIGYAITKTSILTRLQNLVMKYKDKPQKIIFYIMLVALLMGLLTSGTVATAILFPLVISIAESTNISRSKILFPMATVACAGAASTFLGVGASNMAWSSIMMKFGAKAPLSLMSFTWGRLPFLIVAVLYMSFIAPKLLPDHPNSDFDDSVVKEKGVSCNLSPKKEKIAITIIVATIILMILSSYIGIGSYIFSSLGAVALVIFGVLNEKEALSSIKLPTIFLFGGMLGLSDALQSTGAGKLVGSLITHAIGGSRNTIFIMFIFFAIPFIVTQFMSNLATTAIFVPLVIPTALQLGFDPRAAVLAVTTAACMSFMTPLSSPTHVIVYQPGHYTIKDYFKAGWPLAIIFMIMGSLWFQVIYPL